MTQVTGIDIRELRDLILGLDKKIDGLDKRLEVSQARNDERFNSIDQRFSALDAQLTDFKKSTDTHFADIRKSTDTQLADIKIQLRAQDTRLWEFIVTLSLAIIGFLSKLAFFPQT